ncbi:hypothetical protein [Nocardia transvalensis]|uniref:hypothetical protein n=1 Tax=Nocardia transvalensis TaxID=37333 RepID=UPI001893C3DE|nr:hypothetical protein [Nocardia transvalensis]MBF6333654.1 hypothetical protein [Nocardia transvalensis]
MPDRGDGWPMYCYPDEGCGYNEPWGWEVFNARPDEWARPEWGTYRYRLMRFLAYLEGADSVFPAAARAELLDAGWAGTHYGVTVLDLYDPEWGYRPGFVALDHHSNRRRVLAAMNAFAKDCCGWESMFGDLAFDVYPDVCDELRQEWAVLAPAAPDAEDCHDDLLGRMTFTPLVTAETPNAFPVTMWWKC